MTDPMTDAPLRLADVIESLPPSVTAERVAENADELFAATMERRRCLGIPDQGQRARRSHYASKAKDERRGPSPTNGDGSPKTLASILRELSDRSSPISAMARGETNVVAIGDRGGRNGATTRDNWEPVEGPGARERRDRRLAEIASLATRSSPTASDPPLSLQAIASLLAELDALTRHPAGETEEAAAFRLRVYARRLATLPGSAVRRALTEWPDNSAWWPAWADLLEAVERG